MWNVSPIARGLPSRPTSPTAKSSAWVSVHSEVPSPCTGTSAPRAIRSITVQSPASGGLASSYVWEGRTIVIGKPCSAYASCITASARSFARA